ncbi:eukaryotic translation initiation factor 4B isoform X2 [Uranotaenia lowii]|uniref:eukaryotic translation initiation factor 4B isoform X2 n=1 Tax=Uranotaenia lowii TaxID=190385 RepID=UPI00247ACA63|nr:eukaryotic translation initiation factor 4B isoform X2 [Uranotaenia lowii]
MATSSGKKGKKVSKKNKLSLGEFLTDGNATPVSQIQVAVPVKLSNWADECDDEEDDRPVRTQLIALPTAPRATRLLNDDTIPHTPPYLAYISNLPYDLSDNDLYDFFEDMEIVSLRLPRDDGENGRLRGFGNIEFSRREDLIAALSIPEPVIHGRRIRIDISSESEQKRQRNNRGYDNYGGDDRPQGNWRDGPRSQMGEREGGRRNYSNYNRDGGDRRDRDGDRERYPNDSGSGGNWRQGDRPVQPLPSPPPNRRGYGGDRGFRRGADRSGDRSGRREMEPPMERPKLNLQPRTLPMPEVKKLETESDRDSSVERRDTEDKENQDEQIAPRPKPTPVPSAQIFGDAKPVDTAAKLKEFEERMAEKKRLEKEERLRKKAEAEAAAAAADAEKDPKDEGEEKSDPTKEESEEHSGGEGGKVESKSTAEVSNWRVRTDNNDNKDAGRSQSPSRRFTKRNDGRDRYRGGDNRNARDNRRDFNRQNDRSDRGGGFRDRDMNRGGGGRDNRDNRDNYRRGPGGNDRPYDRDQPPRGEQRERDEKPIEERMPKFQEPTGPKLSMTNTFEGLSADEVDD